MQANFIYAAEKRLFVFQKCLFQPPVVRVSSSTLDLVMTACGFVTTIFSTLFLLGIMTRPCDDRLRFCDLYKIRQGGSVMNDFSRPCDDRLRFCDEDRTFADCTISKNISDLVMTACGFVT